MSTTTPKPSASSTVATTFPKQSNVGQLLIKGSYIILLLLECLVYFTQSIPVSIQILGCALSAIIIGSFGSIKDPNSVEYQEMEKMKPSDAYLFPVFGSIVLVSFYVCIKFLPMDIINYCAMIFFTVISSFAVQGFIQEIFKEFCPKQIFETLLEINVFSLSIKKKIIYTLPIVNQTFYVPLISFTDKSQQQQQQQQQPNEDDVTIVDFTRTNCISLLLGFLVALSWYALNEYWLSTNIIGISLCIQAISFLNPGSYYTAFILLCLLFFYDIFWVFGTDVMVTVAKNLKAPIKLVFPNSASEKPNMLGLGDIVLPGIYIALLLRYDVLKCFSKLDNNNNKILNNSVALNKLFNINTFLFVIICYGLSLGICLIVMFYFNHPQPALLYLVPGVIIPVLLLAYQRGDLKTLWNFEESSDADNDKKKA